VAGVEGGGIDINLNKAHVGRLQVFRYPVGLDQHFGVGIVVRGLSGCRLGHVIHPFFSGPEYKSPVDLWTDRAPLLWLVLAYWRFPLPTHAPAGRHIHRQQHVHMEVMVEQDALFTTKLCHALIR
jgi:hypothetical protein